MLSFFFYNIFIGVYHFNILDDIQLINYVTVMTVCSHKYFEIFTKIIMHRATFNSCYSFSLSPHFVLVYKDVWFDDVSHKTTTKHFNPK
jgi:hypothetical protein